MRPYVESERELPKAVLETHIAALRLEPKDEVFYAAQAVAECSPTGRCTFWVLPRRNGKYSVILRQAAAQTFTIQPSLTDGHHDIVLTMHGSATMQGLNLYRFDGVKYRKTDCYGADWEVLDKDGETHELDEPVITACAEA